jgi:hypothetical protein
MSACGRKRTVGNDRFRPKAALRVSNRAFGDCSGCPEAIKVQPMRRIDGSVLIPAAAKSANPGSRRGPGVDLVIGRYRMPISALCMASRLTPWLVAGLALVPPENATAASATATAVEYRHAAWDAYFVTAFPDEIAALDAGAFGGAWTRTGQSFDVWSEADATRSPTCRFFSASFAPRSSHFYTPYPTECATVLEEPAWQFEGIAFYLALPGTLGACAAETRPLYRLYNGGAGGAPNHRYTIDTSIVDAMRTSGWTLEGDGATGIFACVPAPQSDVSAKGLWYGSTSSDSAVYSVVRESGTAFFMYSFSGSPEIAGMIVADPVPSRTRFDAPVARDIYFGSSVTDVAINGTFAPGLYVNVTFEEASAGYLFTATYDADSPRPASVADAAGAFGGTLASAARVQEASLTLSASGEIAGTAAGCTLSGMAFPHYGLFAFDVALTFDGPLCNIDARPLFGVAYYAPTAHNIFVMVAKPDRSDAFMFSGGK